MDPGKDHKADIKSTRKTAVERQYNKRQILLTVQQGEDVEIEKWAN